MLSFKISNFKRLERLSSILTVEVKTSDLLLKRLSSLENLEFFSNLASK